MATHTPPPSHRFDQHPYLSRIPRQAFLRLISMSNDSVRSSDCFLQEGEVWAWGTFRDSSGPIGLMEEGQLQKTPLKVMPGVQVRDFQEAKY